MSATIIFVNIELMKFTQTIPQFTKFFIWIFLIIQHTKRQKPTIRLPISALMT